MGRINTVIFVSNFFNHHQKYISDAFFDCLGEGYLFIETEEMDQERKSMGWGMNGYPPYVITSETFLGNKDYYCRLIKQADVVIIGSAPNSLIRQRLKDNKITFRYSERLLKRGLELWKYPYRFLRWRMCGFSRPCIYILCASAYAAQDYAKFSLFRNRCFKWGYFPKTYHYPDIDDLISTKNPNLIIWVARFLEWKHPEIAVEIGRRLKQNGYSFEINMIGDGPLKNRISDMIKHEKLEDSIHLLGVMSPEEVRLHMEKAEIHIFTSDRNEGWGVVLNEAMNSACVSVADTAIGSAPFLIDDGNNGFLYSTIDELYEKITWLLDNRERQKEIALNAYSTIVTEWNAENAVKHFMELSKNLISGNGESTINETGICSKAK